PGDLVAQLDRLAKKLLFGRRDRGRDSKRRAHLSCAGVPRPRAPERDPASLAPMNGLLRTLVIGSIFFLLPGNARADAEIAVAIRYLQARGTSHSHLYLYREDGKLLRQLTTDNSGQDSSPIFAPDGETIVFTRQKDGAPVEFWSVAPRGGDLKKLAAAPAWYADAKSAPYFTNAKPEAPASPPSASPSLVEQPAPIYKSADGAFEVVLREDPNDEDDQIDGPGHGKHFLLRDLKAGTETEFGKIPGFYGAFEILHLNQDESRHFLLEGTLRVAFFGLHLDSTEGDTVYALDLNGPRFVRLSPNWAAPIPLPGEPAFLTLTENRYVPIPGSKKTANCSYLERWDAKLSRIRYARERSAALCYGASMYRPEKGTRSTRFSLLVRVRRRFASLLLLIAFAHVAVSSAEIDSLEKLADDFWTWRAKYAPFTGDDVNRLERPGGTREWSRRSIDRRRDDLQAFENRWKKIDATGWPIPKQVDYKLIGSALSRVRWELDLNPRWKRDPNFYIEQTLTALAEALTVPAPYDQAQSQEILTRIENIPSILQQGAENLEKPPARFTTVAITRLDGIREGLREMAKALVTSTTLTADKLHAACDRASDALEKFQQQLKQKLPDLPQETALGRDAYIWFLRNVALIPFTPE